MAEFAVYKVTPPTPPPDVDLLRVSVRQSDSKIVVSIYETLTVNPSEVRSGIMIADIVRNVAKATRRSVQSIQEAMLRELDSPTSEIVRRTDDGISDSDFLAPSHGGGMMPQRRL